LHRYICLTSCIQRESSMTTKTYNQSCLTRSMCSTTCKLSLSSSSSSSCIHLYTELITLSSALQPLILTSSVDTMPNCLNIRMTCSGNNTILILAFRTQPTRFNKLTSCRSTSSVHNYRPVLKALSINTYTSITANMYRSSPTLTKYTDSTESLRVETQTHNN
jgi:hypothetical protein